MTPDRTPRSPWSTGSAAVGVTLLMAMAMATAVVLLNVLDDDDARQTPTSAAASGPPTSSSALPPQFAAEGTPVSGPLAKGWRQLESSPLERRTSHSMICDGAAYSPGDADSAGPCRPAPPPEPPD